HIKLIIMDLDMPVMDGRETLSHIARDYPNVPVIVLTGSKNMNDAVDVMKNGAFDFLFKPLEQERLLVSARNGLKMSLMSQEINRLKRKTDGALTFSDLIGHAKGLATSITIGTKAATNTLPVLIAGETGTGKEMFAQAVHGESERATNPFVAVNCGALPEKLVESTLFGHEKGAFTGAVDKALGKFQEASGGSLFLDEIGELPLEAQVKLLRALQQKEVEPVGAAKAVKVDVRVISATNRDLAQEVKEGRFREDLYFRLNVLQIKLPALRERPEDIEDIANYFIDMFCASHQSTPKTLCDDALMKLKSYSWPGNVRELENMMNRSMALCDHDKIQSEDLFFESSASHQTPSDIQGIIRTILQDGRFKSFKELEQEIVAQALDHHDHNISKTARVLGIAKSTLYAKMPPQNDQDQAEAV
ncbi:sigma-54 dependent transcriptional regulator, partial [Alphaproteobacteria bacterium]|nr:sigma-54 dependent transcriptional regulator [Alphaproteobacteria bacterium]